MGFNNIFNYTASTFTTNPIQGVIIAPVANNPFKYKYQGQELQDELGLNWYSFKWRNYMPDIGRFFNHDPLSEKYTYNSPYAFQENKIGMGRELEGLELVHDRNNSVEFRQKFAETVKYMNEKGTSGMMAKLNEQSKTTLVDNTGAGVSYYDPETQSLYWDSTLGLETTEGHLLSPATQLNHEIDHALQDKLKHEQFINDLDPIKSPDSNYENKEERRVITGSEQETALKHGEIKEGQVTRTDHYGQGMEMPDPTSTENATPRDSIELDPVILGK